MSLGTAFRAFFAALSNPERSVAIRELLDAEPSQERRFPPPRQPETAEQAKAPPPKTPPVSKAPAAPKAPPAPQRSEALTLLATLQREARLIDLIEEPLDQFTDAQIGAAARPCLKQCRSTLERLFALRPLADVAEGELLTPPEGASPIRYQWVGDGGASGATQGRVVHPGWCAGRCELAQWTGSDADAMVVAATQLQR